MGGAVPTGPLDRPRAHQPNRATPRLDLALTGTQVWFGPSVLHPRRQLAPDVDDAGDAGHPAQQDVRARGADLVSPLTGGERQGVCDLDLAGSRAEDRAQHQGVLDVLPRRLEGSGRGQRPVPGSRVEEAAEDRR